MSEYTPQHLSKVRAAEDFSVEMRPFFRHDQNTAHESKWKQCGIRQSRLHLTRLRHTVAATMRHTGNGGDRRMTEHQVVCCGHMTPAEVSLSSSVTVFLRCVFPPL